jgi:hypothetical protein
VSECFRFIKRSIPAHVLGRKIGEGLIKLVRKLAGGDGCSLADLVGRLSDWLAKEEAVENAKRFPSETRLAGFRDRHDCILCFVSGCQTVEDVVRKIDATFAGRRCPKCGTVYEVDVFRCNKGACGGVTTVLPKGVRFSSIHKSKGLEANNVFLLRPPGYGGRREKMKPWEEEQERNLDYVAITRARRKLTYVY